jgi:hypothetical protein
MRGYTVEVWPSGRLHEQTWHVAVRRTDTEAGTCEWTSARFETDDRELAGNVAQFADDLVRDIAPAWITGREPTEEAALAAMREYLTRAATLTRYTDLNPSMIEAQIEAVETRIEDSGEFG